MKAELLDEIRAAVLALPGVDDADVAFNPTHGTSFYQVVVAYSGFADYFDVRAVAYERLAKPNQAVVWQTERPQTLITAFLWNRRRSEGWHSCPLNGQHYSGVHFLWALALEIDEREPTFTGDRVCRACGGRGEVHRWGSDDNNTGLPSGEGVSGSALVRGRWFPGSTLVGLRHETRRFAVSSCPCGGPTRPDTILLHRLVADLAAMKSPRLSSLPDAWMVAMDERLAGDVTLWQTQWWLAFCEWVLAGKEPDADALALLLRGVMDERERARERSEDARRLFHGSWVDRHDTAARRTADLARQHGLIAPRVTEQRGDFGGSVWSAVCQVPGVDEALVLTNTRAARIVTALGRIREFGVLVVYSGTASYVDVWSTALEHVAGTTAVDVLPVADGTVGRVVDDFLDAARALEMLSAAR